MSWCRSNSSRLMPSSCPPLVLVVLLHLHDEVLEPGISRELFDLHQLIQVDWPGVANLLRDEVSQERIAQQQPSPGSDPVSLVLELLRPELVERFEESLLDEVGVYGSHTVDGVGTDDGEVGHVDPLLSVLLDTGELPQ